MGSLLSLVKMERVVEQGSWVAEGVRESCLRPSNTVNLQLLQESIWVVVGLGV